MEMGLFVKKSKWHKQQNVKNLYCQTRDIGD